jgi:putative ABC transport system substrate-binding protein
MKRRDFIKVLAGGATAIWPLAAHTQQPERMRRIGILVARATDDPQYPALVSVFLQVLAEKGWAIGRNVQIDTRSTDNSAEVRKHAFDLVALGPDVILAHGAATIPPLLQATRSIPIVFPIVSDPVAAGFVDSLARPGGNVTGFMTAEYSTAGKWLELLKEIAPRVTRAAVFREPTIITGASQFAAIQAVSPYVKVEISPINVRQASEIERDMANFARSPDGGLLITEGPGPRHHSELIISLSARYKLPAIYPERTYVVAGGLISYGVDYSEQYKRSAGYVDRILKGEKPADLPVQAPTKYGLVINLKTAKALGMDVPAQLLARADEVIE